MVTTSYTDARQHLAKYLDRAIQDRELVVITRRGGGSATLIATDELDSLRETVYLLRSPANAARLLGALERVAARATAPSSPEALRVELGLADE
jgi:antitoxin YefM